MTRKAKCSNCGQWYYNDTLKETKPMTLDPETEDAFNKRFVYTGSGDNALLEEHKWCFRLDGMTESQSMRKHQNKQINEIKQFIAQSNQRAYEKGRQCTEKEVESLRKQIQALTTPKESQ